MDPTEATSRRRVLAGIGGSLLSVGLAGCSGGSGSSATETEGGETGEEGSTDGSSSDGGDLQEPNYDGWFENVDNYDTTVDRTDADAVTIAVGAGSSGFAFDPPAVAVSPGTTVTWEWSGEGGSHNVVAESVDFESELIDEADHTFEQTFDSTGVVKYYCAPHQTMGMKGAVAVVE